MKKITNNLLFRVIVAIVLGVGLGTIMPDWLGRFFATFNGIFDQLLKFLIPLIIVGLIVPAIAKLGDAAGKLLLATVGIAYGSTLFAGLSTYGISMSVFPKLLESQINEPIKESSSAAFEPYFSIEFLPFFDVMPALVFAFLVGIGLARLGTSTLGQVAEDFGNIISFLIEKLIIPLLPLFIFGIFLDMTHAGKVTAILHVFLKIIGVIFLMHILLLVFQFIIAGAFAKKNPFKLLGTMMPAYFTALGTQSSAATIPVTLAQAKKAGVHDEIADFSVPLCATIHLAGSTLKIVACVIALMLMQGMSVEFVPMLGFIAMLGVTMIAAPGVPGGAIMAAIGIISSMLGFDAENQALMISLYIAMDSFGTACNVTGDGAIAIVLSSIFKKVEE
ncbi:dicarboxylate/amino acid:cation symporter [Sphingobacterium sp. UT-1RO-CII-1]|uniref:dicarboxylate/amino acid:cation symporter n=1 Tax=Sphingobacterium sp. UT-1RO-CII-1 TaxID=2995225 RepID=UPI00227AA4AC|nr:dicarboxylate/amino acid:cation symporter [Sphingobacterium sp. UT-1RO-CII-1]MCY4778637.1 dicarboxylate/amino acid:cation symporter [Sphingobacterium sp. UT-1RO-CII-1]